MKARISHKLAATPTPMAGLALGIASLGWCWNNLTGSTHTQAAGALIASVLLIWVAAKFLWHPAILRDELAHPVVGSVIPTFSMGLMVVSNGLFSVSSETAAALWLAAVGIHIVFLASFVFHRLREFELHHMVPSWFVPPVGIAVAALTNQTPAFDDFAAVLLGFAMIAYLVMMPLMVYRLIFSSPVADNAKPTLAILAAPTSLCLAAYLQTVEEPSLLLVAMMASLAVLMTVVIYMGFVRLLRLPFTPGYAAFTFPLVISATALFKTAEILAGDDLLRPIAEEVLIGARIELAIATVIVGYVAMRYMHFYAGRN